MPEIDAREWRLSIEGHVLSPCQLDFDSVRNLPARSLTATLECAGNSRMLLPEKVKGVQWELGAVGTAEWTGAPLPEVLERVGIEPQATEVILEGADRGRIDTEPKTDAEIPFARSLPLAKAPEVLLAWAMNGEPLPARHGFPVRAIVPGWYGMASVKWLRRIIVTARPFQGYFQTFEYSHWDDLNGLLSLAPVRQGAVKAGIAFPAQGETIARDSRYRQR